MERGSKKGIAHVGLIVLGVIAGAVILFSLTGDLGDDRKVGLSPDGSGEDEAKQGTPGCGPGEKKRCVGQNIVCESTNIIIEECTYSCMEGEVCNPEPCPPTNCVDSCSNGVVKECVFGSDGCQYSRERDCLGECVGNSCKDCIDECTKNVCEDGVFTRCIGLKGPTDCYRKASPVRCTHGCSEDGDGCLDAEPVGSQCVLDDDCIPISNEFLTVCDNGYCRFPCGDLYCNEGEECLLFPCDGDEDNLNEFCFEGVCLPPLDS
jgi:hypothetical protein